MPSTSETKLLLHTDFLTIVTWGVQRAEDAYNGRLRLLVAHCAYELQSTGPLCTDKCCCYPVTLCFGDASIRVSKC